jgi:hypothetical protein
MKNYFYICLFLLWPSLVYSSANGDKVMTLKLTDQKIKIDGKIDSVWNKADSSSSFIQFFPYYNTEPTRKTTVKLLANESSLYCLIICYDDNENIQKYTGKLDEANGDFVSLMLDTFNDSRSAYKFGVTATGVRSDSKMLDDARNRDYSWDGIWFSDTEIYDWGYVVEMEIPFKSIQYNKDLTYWGLDFDRYIPVNTEDIYWCSYNQNEGQRISKFGKLVFNGFKPGTQGLNLEIYPVGIVKTELADNQKYDVDPDLGLDVFYNPSPALTFSLTFNPDFAQIEADPYDFNITRFESYFGERRPFFTEGQEIFAASGKQRNSGFYKPMELFYSRRIGKKLPDGNEVPLVVGTKAFGRLGTWDYGGFVAHTAEQDYSDEGVNYSEKKANFASARLSRQIMGNSSVGFLFAGKQDIDTTNVVIDIDGALRGSDWQLAYQFARSFKNDNGDYAFSAGLTQMGEDWGIFARTRYVGVDFDIDQIGFVPWQGTAELVTLTGPRWFYETGAVRTLLIYAGGFGGWEEEDQYIDYGGLIGINFNFRSQWGFEINLDAGKSKDQDVKYNSFNASLSAWFNTSPKWYANFYGGYSRTYNFSKEYLGYFIFSNVSFEWNTLDFLRIGAKYNLYIEGFDSGEIDDITHNARPYFSLTPVNDLNISMYVDNVFTQSSGQIEELLIGFFFAYNFLPKSWIYFAYNDFQDRSEEFDNSGMLLSNRLHTIHRAGVFKIKYLYYF